MEETRENGNAPNNTFYVDWSIRNLSHWSRDVFGNSITTTVDFNDNQIDFKVYPMNADGRMEMHFPEEFYLYDGQLIIKDHVFRDISEFRKERGQRILFGPQFEQFRENLRMTKDHFVLCFTLENVNMWLYKKCVFTTFTVLRCISPNGATESHNADDPSQNLIIQRQSTKRLRHTEVPIRLEQLVPSLESLSISRAVEEPLRQNQPFKKDKQVEEKPQPIMSFDPPCETRLSRPSDQAIRPFDPPCETRFICPIRRRRRPPRQQALVQLPADVPTRHHTLEQLLPSLESLSINRDAKEPPSSNERLDEASLIDKYGDFLRKFRATMAPPFQEVGENHLRELEERLLKKMCTPHPPSLDYISERKRDDPKDSRYCPY